MVTGRASGLVRRPDDDGVMRGRSRWVGEEEWGRLRFRRRACCCRFVVARVLVEEGGGDRLDENRG